jgi:SAM-dependent methyltransferase
MQTQTDSVASTRPGEFFDSFADEFDTFYDGKRNRFMQWIDHRFRSDMFERFNKTFSLLDDLTDKTVLDVGCGSSPYIAEAVRRGSLRITGIDPAPAMLELARARVDRYGASSRVEFVRGYFPVVAPDVSHDYAIVMGVMDYVPDSIAFLRALRSAVTIGAAVSFPSVHWFRSPLRRVRYRLRNCPLFLYTEDDIRSLMRSADIERYQIHKVPGAGMDFVVWIRP